MTTVDCLYQPINCNPVEISEICVFKYTLLCLEHFSLRKKLLIANGHLVRTGLEENLGDTYSYTAGLQTATVEVNLIHKAKYSVRLSVVQICICLKEASKTVAIIFVGGRTFFI